MTTMNVAPEATGWTASDGTFGARLALIRQRMGWGNVKEAAVACGLPAESWRTWERDGVMPRNVVDIAERIAERTGCDYGWLLAGARLRDGRTVVISGAPREKTTRAYPQLTFQPTPIGHPIRTPHTPTTRRPARLR